MTLQLHNHESKGPQRSLALLSFSPGISMFFKSCKWPGNPVPRGTNHDKITFQSQLSSSAETLSSASLWDRCLDDITLQLLYLKLNYGKHHSLCMRLSGHEFNALRFSVILQSFSV